MNSAIIYLANSMEANLAHIHYLGSSLVECLADKLKETSVKKIYVVGADYEISGTEKKENMEEIFKELSGLSGKTILVSPFYPSLKPFYFEAMLKDQHDGIAMFSNGNSLRAYAFDNSLAEHCFEINYHSYNIAEESAKEIKDLEELRDFEHEERRRINRKHLKNGVNILDTENTYISEQTRIEKGATIFPNVEIAGNSLIRKNTIITSGSVIKNSQIGESVEIKNSLIENCIIHDCVKIGPMAHLYMKCEVFDGGVIGNFVEMKNVHLGKDSSCASLTYLGDCVVGERVNIGCGVVTVNFDGVRKFATIIKDDAFIGSNTTLIAPLTVGSSAVVAAGSTITDDVKDKAMAIARTRQITKEGYGNRYIKKENKSWKDSTKQ